MEESSDGQVGTIDLTTDEALLESLSEHKVEELKLEPFSLMRQSVAADLCDYQSGTLFNAIMTVWVCTLNPKEALEAHMDLMTSKAKAFEWAEKRGYSLWNWRPVVDMYNKLNREWAAASKAKIQQEQTEGQEEIPNDGGQPES